MKTPRVGTLWILRPAGVWDRADPRVTQWADYIVRVVQPAGCPKNGTLAHCYVETRLPEPGRKKPEFIGLVQISSLQPLDEKTKRAIRRGH